MLCRRISEEAHLLRCLQPGQWSQNRQRFSLSTRGRQKWKCFLGNKWQPFGPQHLSKGCCGRHSYWPKQQPSLYPTPNHLVQRPPTQPFWVVGTSAIVTQGGRHNLKMTTTRGAANHRISECEVMHKPNSNFLAFQSEDVLNRIPSKISIFLKIFSCMHTAWLHSYAEDPCAVVLKLCAAIRSPMAIRKSYWENPCFLKPLGKCQERYQWKPQHIILGKLIYYHIIRT